MKTIKTILVPVDFTDASVNSLKYAIELSRQFNAKLYVLHSYHIDTPVSDSALFPNTEGILYLSTLEEHAKLNVQGKFEQLEKELFFSNIPSREFVAVQGFVEDSIRSFVDTHKVDLVVMASTGAHPGLEFFGSHVTHLINKINSPLLVIPVETKFRKIQNILLATDFGDVSEKVDVVVDFANLDKAEVQIFNNETGYEEYSHNVIDTATRLNHILKSIPHKYHKEYFEDVEEGILNYINHNKVDLLVVIPRRHNIIQRIFGKSITKNMTFHTTVPLLIIPE